MLLIDMTWLDCATLDVAFGQVLRLRLLLQLLLAWQAWLASSGVAGGKLAKPT